MFVFHRASIDRQIALDKLRREEIERGKAQELKNARQQLTSWQEGLEEDDESDYEEDLLQSAGQKDGGDCGGNGSAGSDGSGKQGDAASPADAHQRARLCARDDHPDYHGKGWSSGRVQQEKGGNGDVEAAWNQMPDGRCHGSDDCDEEDGVDELCRSSSVMGDEENAMAAGSSSACSSDGSEDGESNEDHETVCTDAKHCQEHPTSIRSRSSSSRHSCGTEHPLPIPIQPTVPVTAAPMRRAACPVQVAFTLTESPHLPAREQREEELRQYKKANCKEVLEDSTDVADRQPAFLKDKGDALFGQGNYRCVCFPEFLMQWAKPIAAVNLPEHVCLKARCGGSK
jgi:dyslexia susceptibility 1 candidate gene 1 protein